MPLCSEETLAHLFLHSDITKESWRCFGSIFRLSIANLIHRWMSKVGNLSHFDFCRGATAAFILWEIWVSRCAATYEGIPMGAHQIYMHESNFTGSIDFK